MGLSLLSRLWVSAVLPLTGDEALFYWWSRFPDYGYYDHPPMVAWAIGAARALLGDATWALRMPATLLPLGVCGAIWWAWAPVNRVQAGWAVLLYALTPINWLNALVATDTPLIFWCAWSVACLLRAERDSLSINKLAWRWYALSGLCMAGALLSKYFAVLLGLGYVAYFALSAPRRWLALIWLGLWALPGLAVNLQWNYTHCWTNIMFNLFNRNEGATASWDTVLSYLLMLLYLLGPGLCWVIWKERQALWQVLKPAPTPRPHLLLAGWAAAMPLLIFGLMSVKKVIGLHWVMAFYPFVFVWLLWALPPARWAQVRRGLVAFLAVHLVLAGVLSALPLRTWQHMGTYHRLVEAARSKEMVAQALQGTEPGVVLASNAYSAASVFGYAAGRHVPVLGMGSLHARQDDLWVDYRQFEGKTIRVLVTRQPNVADYAPYFDRVTLLRFTQDGAPFFAIEGVGFHYEAYRSNVLQEVNRRYYAFPAWLPVGDCVFCRRLCGHSDCL
jgi:hypothetical protein